MPKIPDSDLPFSRVAEYACAVRERVHRVQFWGCFGCEAPYLSRNLDADGLCTDCVRGIADDVELERLDAFFRGIRRLTDAANGRRPAGAGGRR